MINDLHSAIEEYANERIEGGSKWVHDDLMAILKAHPAGGDVGLREAVVQAAIQWYCSDDDFIDVRSEWLTKAVQALPEFTPQGPGNARAADASVALVPTDAPGHAGEWVDADGNFYILVEHHPAGEGGLHEAVEAMRDEFAKYDPRASFTAKEITVRLDVLTWAYPSAPTPMTDPVAYSEAFKGMKTYSVDRDGEEIENGKKGTYIKVADFYAIKVDVLASVGSIVMAHKRGEIEADDAIGQLAALLTRALRETDVRKVKR